MSLIASITEKAFRAIGAKEAQRNYAAAGRSRLVGDWTTDNHSANQEVRSSIRVLRARGRQLARDNDYFIGFLKKLEANVIGTAGLRLQVNAKNSDKSKNETLNRSIEAEFRDWSRKENCDVTGQSSLRGLASLALRTAAIDGEFLFRCVFDPSSEYGLKLQMLDVDWLDEDYNDAKLPNGNRVVMSVEIDNLDKPVAYHLTNPKWSNVTIPGMRLVPSNVPRLRIPADQILHRFVKTRAGQSRGITWAHGAMLTLNQLDGFDEAELVGQRIAASNMAFVSPPVSEGEYTGNAKPGELSTEVSPGQILELPQGYTVHEFDASKPVDSGFSKRMLRKVATSLGVNYNTLTSDLEGVNFSSIRAGTVEEREIWKSLHEWMAEQFYQDIYTKWLMFNAHLVPATKLKQVFYPIWRGRGFDWVDPSKDINADVVAIDRGIKTIREVIEQKGHDFEETMEQHAADQEFIRSLGLNFASPADLALKLAEQSKEDEESEDKEKDSKDPKAK